MCFGLPGQLIEAADADTGLALVAVGGRPRPANVRPANVRPINMALLCEDPPAVGDWVLIHAGFALSRLAESDALAVLEMLDAAEHGGSSEPPG